MSRTSRSVAENRSRLLKAAIEVFSTEGYVGATTREIARVAKVSEVTLFRHFQSKEQLLSAVAQHITALRTEAFNHQDEWTYDLRRDLLHYAKLHDNMLEEYEALFRMFIGEAHRHPTEAVEVLQQSFLPLREKLIAYLQVCIERGNVCPDIDLSLAVDQLTGMLLSGMIRRHVSPVKRGYSRKQYVEGCVDLFVRGISQALSSTTEPDLIDIQGLTNLEESSRQDQQNVQHNSHFSKYQEQPSSNGHVAKRNEPIELDELEQNSHPSNHSSNGHTTIADRTVIQPQEHRPPQPK